MRTDSGGGAGVVIEIDPFLEKVIPNAIYLTVRTLTRGGDFGGWVLFWVDLL